MSPEVIALFFIVLAMVLLCLGVHIGLALAIAGTLGIAATAGSVDVMVGVLKTTPYHAVGMYAWTVVPLFILMGYFSLYGGISTRAYQAITDWVGRLPGGLSIATTWACTAFGATSGSYIAAATVFTKISLPEMKKAGYEPRFACGGIATAAIIAMIIPPSLFLVMYGALTQASIAKMLIGGIIPGIIMAISLSAVIWIQVLINPALAPRPTVLVTWREKLGSTGRAWAIVLLAAIIIGGIYTGVFTPTEASAVAAFVALVICLGYRSLTWNRLRTSLIETAELTALLFFIVIGACIFSRFLTISGVTTVMLEAIIGLGLPPVGFVIGYTLLCLIMGCFIDPMSAMFITLPFFFPAVLEMGIDPIWFGVVTVVALDIGAITPPFGLSVYTVRAVAGPDVSVEDIFRGAFPYYISMLAALAALIAFPQLVLFLPNMMG